MHDFRKLEVYKRALKFISTIRKITLQFPKDELFGLTSQYRRAADSIALNIAEGSGCSSKKEFAKFIGYAIRSGYECSCCGDISMGEHYLSEVEYQSILKETNEIIAMLIGLQRSISK